MVNIKAFVFNPFRENTYFVWDEEGSLVVIDPSFYYPEEQEAFYGLVARENLTLKEIWLTHGHFDHIFGVAGLQRKYSVPVLMGEADAELVALAGKAAADAGLNIPDTSFSTTALHDSQVLGTLKDSPFTAIATPGHSEGGFCFYDSTDKVLFSGDTLFAGTIGRTDLFGGEYDKLIVSVMDRLMGLPGDVDVLPGHGGWTTIGNERTGNPFLQPFNEPEEDSDPGLEAQTATEG
ncbi:MAG: MBL fold metallo-hydrolase [Candidatus Cryptobacteroides sp.]